jgi:hypothetical protein
VEASVTNGVHLPQDRVADPVLGGGDVVAVDAVDAEQSTELFRVLRVTGEELLRTGGR